MGEPTFARWTLRVIDLDVITWTFWQAAATVAQIEANDTSLRLPLDGIVFRLSIEWEGGSLLLVSGTDAEITVGNQAVADERGQLSIALTAEQRALLPVDGRIIRWNLQAVDGSIRATWIFGEIIAVKWVNNA